MIYTNSFGDRTGSPCKGALGPLAGLDDYCHAAPRHLGRRRFFLSRRCQLRTATVPLTGHGYRDLECGARVARL